ncbi:hypothetical protein B0A50_06016 [Salinomyces thailandicus]|uniref:Arabinanase/levansucrase/invertase n=1 Tax=Salinomyces thailandicus TaxID=706561 RepID=A0A4U0TQW9_9PEZI|nr:hypothetical protein B0A50_06016 [Salinomyces thailandica]
MAIRPRLTFFQKHFTKPIDQDPEKEKRADNRHFTFFSHGSLLVGAVMLFILVGIIAAAVAVTLDRHNQQHDTDLQPHKNLSPIRLAVLENFPDPTLWYNDGTYYAFATNNAAGILEQPKNFSAYQYGTSNVQIATSTNFVNWTLLTSEHDPLPDIGKWVTHGLTKGKTPIPKSAVWAPGVIQRKTDNKLLMYYSASAHAEGNATTGAHVTAKGRHPVPHCIGAAVSSTSDPAGPYDPVPEPLACPIAQGGAIDPAPFADKDGTLYLTYKIDGNNIGHGGLCGNTRAPIVPTPLKLQKLAPDGLTPLAAPITILDRTASDGPLIEAPALIRSHEGIYFLFYSSGCTRSPTYNVKYATADTVTGPYTRSATTPVLQSGAWGLEAPGSVGVHEDASGGFRMVFHARVKAEMGRVRAMFSTGLVFEGRNVSLVR